MQEIFVNLTCINRTPVYSEYKSWFQWWSVKTNFTVLLYSINTQLYISYQIFCSVSFSWCYISIAVQSLHFHIIVKYINNYVSPSNEGRHIVLVWFFLPLLLSEDCPDHNFFVFPDKSIIFGMWVHDHKAVCRIP